ncbi:MAG: hypothetical protein QM803_13660 [Rhodocyclaceae bacterium]
MRPSAGDIDPMWFLLFDEHDLRFAEMRTQQSVRHVPYFVVSVAEALRRLTEDVVALRALERHRPDLIMLLNAPDVRASGYFMLDTWALWQRCGDDCAGFCMGHIRRMRLLRERSRRWYCLRNAGQPCTRNDGACHWRAAAEEVATCAMPLH